MSPDIESNDASKTQEELHEAIAAGGQGNLDDDEDSIDIIPRSPNRKLSTISKAYDRGDKGFLDEEERALRNMDSQNLGYLDTNKAVRMFRELHDAQAKNVTNRRIIIALSVFAVLLSLANIGTAFAAATLAKDTRVESGQFVDKNTGERLAVTPQTLSVMLEEDLSATPTDEGGRRLSTKLSSVTKTSVVKLLDLLCSNVPPNLDFAAANVVPQSDWCQRTGHSYFIIEHCENPTYQTFSWLQGSPIYSNDGFFNEYMSLVLMAQRGGVLTGLFSIKCNLANYVPNCEVGNIYPNGDVAAGIPATTTELYCSIPCAPTTLCPTMWWCPEPDEWCNYNVTTTAECGQCTMTVPG